MSLYNGLDITAIASGGVHSATYGSAEPANTANLYASRGHLEGAPAYTPPIYNWIKKVFDWFWEMF